MRFVSMAFQVDRADRPASNASRKPSSVSPSGVLTAIPVMTMRLVADKVDLHHGECAYRRAFQDLAGAYRGVVVRANEFGDDFQLVAGKNLGEKHRLMNLQDADAAI